jgi:hypothetical protein
MYTLHHQRELPDPDFALHPFPHDGERFGRHLAIRAK